MAGARTSGWLSWLLFSSRNSVVLTAVLLLYIGLGGCASPFQRTLLPAGLPPAAPEIRSEHETAIDDERIQLTREYLEIHNPPLAAGRTTLEGLEAIRMEPQVVVVHYTAIPTLQATLAAFAAPTIGSYREVIRQNGLLNVGIHFVVDRQGAIYRLYPETVISRHVIGLNHVAIGIENVGSADLSGPADDAPLTEAQLEANVLLIRYLAGRYPSLRYVIGHSEYTDLENPDHPAHDLFFEAYPDYRTEKVDPGRRFLRRLRRELRRSTRD